MLISENEVAAVKVGIGFSTLLQFETRPSQVIVGDQDSFKVEYIGDAIAIKPLMSGVATNLFVVTQAGKFNFRISAVRGLEPDYVLRIKRKSEDLAPGSTALQTRLSNSQLSKNGLTLSLKSVASTQSNSVLIFSFDVKSMDRQRSFEPGDFEIIQGDRSISIESIYLDRILLKRGELLNGMILIRRSAVQRSQKIWLKVSEGRNKQGIQLLTPNM
ncbi:MAG: TrbG/VirB9 family P-type conjugative transfer protein [Bdellovibrionales bacterium]|nr:TrbG/VirB9 family P-type conjugative transfer protein [Bdellovibrionales bacterium]